MITTTFEEQLARLIDLLPPHKNLNPDGSVRSTLPIRFNWGTIEKLNAFLVTPETISKYPLIWLVEGKDSENYQYGTIKRRSEIIIATQTLSPNRFNPEIYVTDYKDILNPIKNNLIKVLRLSGISLLNPEYTVNRIKDYKFSEKDGILDIWNVIQIEAEITFENTSNCLKQIDFTL